MFPLEDQTVLVTASTISHVQKVFASQGSDAWWKLTTEELLPPSMKDEAHKWTRGKDTMDVWFDSGSSWAGVVKARPELTFPADVYLEGHDQYRGWFHSSLLVAVNDRDAAPYRGVVTHGFTLDDILENLGQRGRR